MSSTVRVEPAAHLGGIVHAPGDKSISHRALLLSALGEGTSSIHAISTGEDVGRTARIIEQLGASVAIDDARLVITGGRDRLRVADAPLDCGNSGTTMRLVMGLVAGLSGDSTLCGDSSLSRRPMDRVARPLMQMGASVSAVGATLHPPVLVSGGGLTGIRYELPIPSAQVKSAVLLAGLFASGTTTVVEATPTRPNTEEMLQTAGADLTVATTAGGTELSVRASALMACDWVVAADPSQAAFFVVAGLLARTGSVTATGLYGDPTRIGFLSVLERMGGKVERSLGPLLDVTVSPSDLRSTEIHSTEIPSVDEVPILTVAAAAASGVTRFVDVGELRIKESDRFAGSIGLARGLGANAWAEDDDLLIEGLGSAREFTPLTLDALGDHRMAMAAAIAGTVGAGAAVAGFTSVATSFPGFLDVLNSLR